MAVQDQDDEEITAINVTPLVDVMLVLLVIFMVTASYIVNRSVNIQLPKMQTSSTDAAPKSIEFTLDEKANLYLDGTKVSYTNLSSKVEEKKKEFKAKYGNRQIQALVSADLKTPHGKVIELIDKIKTLGIQNFAINVETQGSSAS